MGAAPAQHESSFWMDLLPRDRLALRFLAIVVGRSLVFGLVALGIVLVDRYTPLELASGFAPYEAGGVALGLLLALRTNASYERWWEGRRLWGGITNQSRNLVVAALAYGPDDVTWRTAVARWTAAFAHVTRMTLRGLHDDGDLTRLLGPEETARVVAARHMGLYVSSTLARLLREALDSGRLSREAFFQMERERLTLIDHLGGCERIQKTPLPRVYAVADRMVLAGFLVLLPFGLLARLSWGVGVTTFLVAIPILALDEIGAELQNPFPEESPLCLPLASICATIEGDLLDLPNGKNGPASAC